MMHEKVKKLWRAFSKGSRVATSPRPLHIPCFRFPIYRPQDGLCSTGRSCLSQEPAMQEALGNGKR